MVVKKSVKVKVPVVVPVPVTAHVCPSPPAYIAELVAYAVKHGKGATTLADELRFNQISGALAKGVAPPPRVEYVAPAPDISGNGRIPRRRR